MKSTANILSTRNARSGFSLFELAISSLLTGVLLVASLQSVSSSMISQRIMSDRAKASLLADGMAMEIHQQAYMEPGTSSSSISRESGESAGFRANYDDVDDYHGWSESPPSNKDGTKMDSLTGYQRSVTVTWVLATNLATSSATETGVKKAVVTVRLNGTVLATRVLVRTKGS